MLKQVREITFHAHNIRHPPPTFVHCTQETLRQIWCLLPVSNTLLKITLNHSTTSMHDTFTDKELWKCVVGNPKILLTGTGLALWNAWLHRVKS